jgi:hypothetical protein
MDLPWNPFARSKSQVLFTCDETKHTSMDLPLIPPPADIVQQATTDETTPSDLRMCIVYGLCTPDGTLVYNGSSTQSQENRFTQHKVHARRDPLSAPLYRYAMELQGANADPTHSMDGWTIHVFGTMQIDNTRCRDAMKRYEQHCIRTVRMTPLGEHLLNTNKALDENRPRANYQKEWRRRENERRTGLGLPSWNAEMSARYRERRRLRLQNMRNEIAQEAHTQAETAAQSMEVEASQ